MIHIAKPDAELLDALTAAGVLDAATAEELRPPSKRRKKPAPEEPRSKPARRQQAAIKPVKPPRQAEPPAEVPAEPQTERGPVSVLTILMILAYMAFIIGLGITLR